MRKLTATLVMVLTIVLAACAPAATPAPMPAATEAPAAQPTAAQPTAEPTPEPASMPTPAASGMEAEPKDIVDLAIADGRFGTLVAAVQAAGLVDTLKGEGPFTVFAPTDEAFAKLPSGTVEGLLAKPDELKDILLYHVVPGKVMAADVLTMDGKSAETALAGKSIAIKIDGDKVMLNDNSQVLITDVEASNGVIHVIDTVILPPADDAAMAEEPEKDIVETAIADGRFGTLVAAVQAAGLVDTLKGEGPFTVFAPTDEAFAKLPAGTVEGLLAKPDELKDILLYHVVPGKVMAADVLTMDGKSAETALAGKSITIKIDGDKVMLNDTVMVVITDIVTSNGVIHVIDAVLLPPEN